MQRTLLATAFSAAALVAQPPQIIEDKQIHVMATPAIDGTFAYMNAEMSFESTVVKGVPFSGDFVTENSQTLADGNRIRNTNTTSYARDGEGRTRREVTIDAIGPFTDGASRKTIFIHDPVTKTDYILDPQEKTARKIVLGSIPSKIAAEASAKAGRDVAFTRRVDGPRERFDVMVEHGAESGPVAIERIAPPPGLAAHHEAGVVVSHRVAGAVAGGVAAAGSIANFKSDSIGKRIIEGVEAEGTRTTVTIPAGQIGNDLPLDTVSERWYSNELKTVVLTTRKDPRTGDNTYKLINLRRGEPSRQLFEVPSDFKLVAEDIIGPKVFRMKIDNDAKREE